MSINNSICYKPIRYCNEKVTFHISIIANMISGSMDVIVLPFGSVVMEVKRGTIPGILMSPEASLTRKWVF